jgi:hypothetical protein
MLSKYRIEPGEQGYVVIDTENGMVGAFKTRQEAEAEIRRCQQEDAVWETSKLLVGMSINTLMQMHEVDRETARYWTLSAAECAE